MPVKHLSPEVLNLRRNAAVKLRLSGCSIAEAGRQTGLSAPTVIAAFKAFRTGGWAAVAVKPRGRKAGQGLRLAVPQQASVQAWLIDKLPSDDHGKDCLWHTGVLQQQIAATFGTELTSRSLGRLLEHWGWVAPDAVLARPRLRRSTIGKWFASAHDPLQRWARAQQAELVWAGVRVLPATQGQPRCYQLYAQGPRRKQYWLLSSRAPDAALYIEFFNRLVSCFGAPLALVLQGAQLDASAHISEWLEQRSADVNLVQGPTAAVADACKPTCTPTRTDCRQPPECKSAAESELKRTSRNTMALTHLQRLEAESIHIMREVVAEADNPVMLYSVGKDSAVMLHLAMKAFAPSPPPFPLLHVDTRWKFREMYALRDRMAEETGMDLLVHINPEGVAKNINPFTHGSAIHTDVMKTEGLKQALDKYGFDAAFGGARRDEEKSRAKERIFSFRSTTHRWDPKDQRPELWKLYNARKLKGESMRVFPISNWTELDIWQYIHLENIPIVPLYFAAERPVVERDGALIMVDDERMPLEPGEVPMMRKVRFRTLGCYPLTGAVESEADTLPLIIQEMLLTTTSERQGRVIDHDSAASMEKKKQEGYF